MYEAPSNQLCCIWLNLGREYILYTSEFFRLLLSSVTSSINISNLSSTGIALDHELFQAFSILFYSRHSGTGWISAIQRMLFQKCGFFRSFWQSLIWPCLSLCICSSWRLLLIVDFDRDTSTSWRVFFSLLDVVKGFVFTMERIFWSSNTVVLCRRPVLFMFLSSAPVLCLFSECTKLLIWPLLMFLLSLWWICCLTIICFTCMDWSFDRMLWVQSNSF